MERRKPKSSRIKPVKRNEVLTLSREHIPAIQVVPTYHKVLRFRNLNTDATAETTLTIGDLLAALGVVSVSSTQGYMVAKAVKVLKIEIWGAPKSDDDSSYAETFIDWHSSSGFSSGNKKADISISNAHPVYVSSKPPRGSLCEFWCELTTVQYATIRVPINGIVDVTVNWKQAEESLNGPVTSIFSVGFMYYGKLDFSTTALLAPVGLASFGSSGKH
jgi:hypothetical protein